MKFFEQMGIEQKYGAVFGLAAFIFSFLTGLVSGVSFSVTVIRSLIMAPVFFIVGYGIITVLKKYVPEIYEALAAAGKSGESGLEGQAEINLSDIEPGADEYGESGKEKGEEFTEFTQKDFDRYKTTEDSGLDTALNTSGGKMGKHIIVQEQFNSYEPKIMAQAIRTMMSKDKD
jgi:hypothetical protein